MNPSGTERAVATAPSVPAQRAEFPILGTGAVVMIADVDRADPERLEAAVRAARAEIERIDRSCSRFRPDSDLERVNDAAGRAVPVSADFLDALDVALAAARVTDGDVDPTVGRALRMLGYDRDFASVRSGPPIVRFAEVPGWQVVTVDRTNRTVSVPSGVRLDLGATAKALAADRAASAASAATGCGVLVSLGGDISCAGEAPDDGWTVRVTEWHGAGPDAPGETIVVRDGGLATSSTTVRHWDRGGTDVNHLVDPASGRAVTPFWRTVTVAARSCVQANIATTATIVRGERGRAWLDTLGVPARLVRADGTVAHVGPWPTSDVGTGTEAAPA